MSYLELKSGRIVGAKPNTLNYFHEEGHIIFNEKPESIKLRYWREHLPIYAIFYLSLTLFSKGHPVFDYALRLGAFLTMVIFIFIYEYEEIFCWGYAFKQRNLFRKGLR